MKFVWRSFVLSCVCLIGCNWMNTPNHDPTVAVSTPLPAGYLYVRFFRYDGSPVQITEVLFPTGDSRPDLVFPYSTTLLAIKQPSSGQPLYFEVNFGSEFPVAEMAAGVDPQCDQPGKFFVSYYAGAMNENCGPNDVPNMMPVSQNDSVTIWGAF